MGVDNPPSLPLVGGVVSSLWLMYVPVLEFVHLLDMYVLLIESLIIVPCRCLQCTLVKQMVHTLFNDLSLDLNNGYCLCSEVCACYIHFL